MYSECVLTATLKIPCIYPLYALRSVAVRYKHHGPPHRSYAEASCGKCPVPHFPQTFPEQGLFSSTGTASASWSQRNHPQSALPSHPTFRAQARQHPQETSHPLYHQSTSARWRRGYNVPFSPFRLSCPPTCSRFGALIYDTSPVDSASIFTCPCSYPISPSGPHACMHA